MATTSTAIRTHRRRMNLSVHYQGMDWTNRQAGQVVIPAAVGTGSLSWRPGSSLRPRLAWRTEKSSIGLSTYWQALPSRTRPHPLCDMDSVQRNSRSVPRVATRKSRSCATHTHTRQGTRSRPTMSRNKAHAYREQKRAPRGSTDAEEEWTMLVAVTGANGFLGSYTVAALRRAGHRVRALALPQARRDHVAAFVDEWQTGDQGDPSAVAGLVAGAGAIVHIAIDWTALNAGAIPNFERNLLSSLRLLEAARVAQARQFIFVSTLEVYHEILPEPPDR